MAVWKWATPKPRKSLGRCCNLCYFEIYFSHLTLENRRHPPTGTLTYPISQNLNISQTIPAKIVENHGAFWLIGWNLHGPMVFSGWNPKAPLPWPNQRHRRRQWWLGSRAWPRPTRTANRRADEGTLCIGNVKLDRLPLWKMMSSCNLRKMKIVEF